MTFAESLAALLFLYFPGANLHKFWQSRLQFKNILLIASFDIANQMRWRLAGQLMHQTGIVELSRR